MNKIFIAGSLNVDFTIDAAVMPKSGETVPGNNFSSDYGGKGGNCAVAAAKLGGEAYMIGCAGDDKYGQEITDNLLKYNVNCDFVRRLPGNTGAAFIVLSNGENRFIVDGGANQKLSYTQVKSALSAANEGDIFITSFEIPLDVAYTSLRHAKSLKMYTILNPAPAKKMDFAISKQVDLLIVNQKEMNLNTGFADAAKGAEFLLNAGFEKIIITLGSDGAYYYSKNESEKIPALKVKAADVTGAGDTFVGACAVRLAAGIPLIKAARYANKAAAVKTLKRGAYSAIPTAEEVENYGKK